MNMIYDRMVQNMRDGSGGDWEERECDRPGARERRLRQRRKEELVFAQLNAKDCQTFNPKYQAGEMRSDDAAGKKPEPAVQDERLFGDPPPKRDWSWLLKIGEFALALFMMGSLCAFVLLAAAAASAGKGNKENRPVPVEVEK